MTSPHPVPAARPARPGPAPCPVPAWSCRCGRPPSRTPAPSAAAGTCPPRPPTRPRCCPPSPPPPSPATPSPATWSPTRCAASAPPWSRPSTWAATASASSSRTAGPRSPPRTSPTPAATAPPGSAEVIRGDARQLPALLPPGMAGRAALVVTSPPYGPSVHGQVRAEQRHGGGGVEKYDNRYSRDPANLAHHGLDDMLAGFTQILAGCKTLLRPGGLAVVTARPWRPARRAGRPARRRPRRRREPPG